MSEYTMDCHRGTHVTPQSHLTHVILVECPALRASMALLTRSARAGAVAGRSECPDVVQRRQRARQRDLRLEDAQPREAATPVVCVRGLDARRGTARVLYQLDLTVHRGEVIAVCGRSGAGKSTLLAVLAGLIEPTSGEVVVGAVDLAAVPDRVRSRVRLNSLGLVFQTDELLPELTIAENVSLPLRLRAGPMGRSANFTEQVVPVLARLGIADLADRTPNEVSGGQLQRAAVARAVIHGPSLVLADEPTDSLDADAATTAMGLLVEVARERGAAVVIVTHDGALARTCDRVLVLRDGRLIPQDDLPVG